MCQAKPDERVAVWFKRWKGPIRNWLTSRSSVPAGDVDDLAQEVFLRLLRYSSEVTVNNIQGYLFRIAANVANEWRDKSVNRNPHEPEWLDDLPDVALSDPANLLEQESLNKLVNGALHSLTPRQRKVVILHIFENMTYKQVASKLGITYRMVLRDLTRGYNKLRLALYNRAEFSEMDAGSSRTNRHLKFRRSA